MSITVNILGRLTRDPEVKYTPAGTPIAEFGVVADHGYKNKDGNKVDNPCFLEVSIIGKSGEAFAKYHKKGHPCSITGKLDYDQWEKDGVKRSKHRCKVGAFDGGWEFVPQKKRGEAAPGADSFQQSELPGTNEVSDEDIPF